MFKKNEFEKIAFSPKNDPSNWLTRAEDGVNYLVAISQSRDLILHACVGDVFIHAVMAPMQNLLNPDMEDLRTDHVDPFATWGIEETFDDEDDVRLYTPFDYRGSALAGGENLVVLRRFEGVEKETKIEVSQRLIHALDLYWRDDHNAFCRLDHNGDLQKVISFVQIASEVKGRNEQIVTADAILLSKYLAVTDSLLVVKFDFTRTSTGDFHGWIGQGTIKKPSTQLIYHTDSQGNGSYANGVLLVPPRITKKDLVGSTDKHYVAFKAYDWKNGVEKEISCAPDALASYFDASSPLPYEVTPAFFRPEVLQKYRADPDKYTLKERSIESRAGWYLKTYDLNDEGQVHTYLCYLADLPYEEQLYWRSFNEWPKAPIAERAYQTDILGRFPTVEDSLTDLPEETTSLSATSASAKVVPKSTTFVASETAPSTIQTNNPVDVLIIAALPLEYNAAREAANITDWTPYTNEPSFSFEQGSYCCQSGKVLQVAIARPSDMGPWGTFPVITALTQALRPRCLAMCGVCAGKPTELALGDVVISKFTYAYEEGKHTTDGFVGDHMQFPILHRWLKAAQELKPDGLPSYSNSVSDEDRKIWLLQHCLESPEKNPLEQPIWERYFSAANWKPLIQDLEQQKLVTIKAGKLVVTKKGEAYVLDYRLVETEPIKVLPFKIRVGPIASGSAVLKDGLIWNELTRLGVRSILGAEMEAAAVGIVAHKFEINEWVVVKAVMDYAGINKNDRYKPFAAMASAQVLFRFLEKQLQ